MEKEGIVHFEQVVAEAAPMPDTNRDEGADVWAATASYIPREHRAKVGEATQIIHSRMANIVRDIIEIGKQLTGVKAILEHGEFLTWIDLEFKFSKRTAQRWMNVYRRFGTKDSVFQKMEPTALIHLTERSTPKTAIAEVERLLKQGKSLRPKEVLAIIAKHKRPASREQEATAARIAKTLRRALTALSNQTIADCERLMGKEAATRLAELGVELTWVLDQVQAHRRPAKWTMVSAPAPLLPVQMPGVDDGVTQLSDAKTELPRGGRVADVKQIGPGCTVSVRDVDTGQEACYILNTEEPGQPENGSINWASPVAQALCGKREGEIVTIDTPGGAIQLDIIGVRSPDGQLTGVRVDGPGEPHREVGSVETPAIFPEGADELCEQSIPSEQEGEDGCGLTKE